MDLAARYYYNRSTGRTSWDRPTIPSPLRPPPPPPTSFPTPAAAAEANNGDVLATPAEPTVDMETVVDMKRCVIDSPRSPPSILLRCPALCAGMSLNTLRGTAPERSRTSMRCSQSTREMRLSCSPNLRKRALVNVDGEGRTCVMATHYFRVSRCFI